MYRIYIKNFKRNGATVADWEEMLAIPSLGDFPINKPIIKASEDNAENLSFSMEMTSPYYDSLLQLKTVVKVIYDGPNNNETDIIFMGRVFVISTTSVHHTKNVTCQGTYSYFNDTYYEGVQDKFKSKITTDTYFTRIINKHNTNAPDKQIQRGTLIGISLPSDEEKFEPTSWSQTSSLLNELTNANGGHFIIRYSGSTPYLDWYKYYHRDLGDGARPSVKVGKNIIDISAEHNAGDIFTRVIPIGGTNSSTGKTIYIDGYKYTKKDESTSTHSGKAFPISKIRELYTDNQLTDEFHDFKDYRDAESLFGIIYKTVSFPNADSQSKLWNTTKKWVKECYFGLNPSFTVKAYDMHIEDASIPKILLGDLVDVTYKIIQNGTEIWVTKPLVCKSVQYDLFNPENNSYTFGIPSDLLEYNKFNKKSSSKPTASNPPQNTPPAGPTDDVMTWHKAWQIIGGESTSDYGGTAAANSFYENGEMSGSGTFYDPTETGSDGEPIGTRVRENKDKWFSARIIGKITIRGKSTKWVAYAAGRGLFGYVNAGDPNAVTHWYIKGAKDKYEGHTEEEMTFEKVAKLIDYDTDANYGGSEKAEQFRANGQISKTLYCYEVDTTKPDQGRSDQFLATTVGKFGNPGSVKWVAISKDRGIFGFTYSSFPNPVGHWYQRSQGNNHTPVNNMTNDSQGNTYGTDNGMPDGHQTIGFHPTQMSTINWPDWDSNKKYKKGAVVKKGSKVYICKPAKDSQGRERKETGPGWVAADWEEVPSYSSTSQGTVSVGYDTTSQGDNWRIQINTPIVYTGEDGNVHVADGGVSASDFNVREVPSFRTRLAVVDVLIAGLVEADEVHTRKLEAQDAFIKNLKGQGANIVDIVAGHLAATEIVCNHIKINTPGSGSISPGSYLDTHAFAGCRVYPGKGTGPTDLEGHIYITFNDIWGTDCQTVNFNIADTQKYKDDVSAARTTGWNAARGVINNSLPTGAAIPIDSAWNLQVPNQGYQSGSTNKAVTITNVVSYKYSGVTINAIKAQIDGKDAYIKSCDNLKPANVKNGVKILGVTGTYSGTTSVTLKPATAGFAADPGSKYSEIWSNLTFKKDYWYTFNAVVGGANHLYKFKLKM